MQKFFGAAFFQKSGEEAWFGQRRRHRPRRFSQLFEKKLHQKLLRILIPPHMAALRDLPPGL
ncbi:hypothetical protein [Acidocella sp. MX-AZ02]|uniref:hypothetical protein n=1 Tax=Acidocella sp. MX-AZ02 TaxID=1214225 RepID=UPI001181B2E5|nr:hypothetical protein [Acidocella sp. MX-AZ02]